MSVTRNKQINNINIIKILQSRENQTKQDILS